GSMSRRNFTDKGKERFLSRKDYSEFGLLNESFRTTNNEDAADWWNDVRLFFVNVYQMGRSDPRHFIFAAKSGLAFAIVCVLIFFKEPFNYVTQYSIWAVITVILVFEFSIGATLNKGFNVALGMLSAGVLALAIAQLSMWAGELRKIVIVISIFIEGSISSHIKLYPSMKPYEYGFRIFTLTFCVVLVSGTSHIDQTVLSRSLLVVLGTGVCLVVSICVFPVWAGEDLHKLVVKNFRGVATSLEGCVSKYLQHFGYERIPSKILVYQASDDPLYSGYRSAVQSSSEEETLLGFAVWEPPHGRYKMLRYPWSSYVKVSGALRHCAFMVMGMHSCILAEIQASVELRNLFQNEILKVGTEGAKVLRELGSKVERMEKLSPDIDLLMKVHEAAEELQLTIDQNSYHLINSDKREHGRQPKGFEDPDIVQELKEDEIKPKLLVKFRSETNLNLHLNRKSPLPTKSLDRKTPYMSRQPSMLHWGSSVDVVKKQSRRPAIVHWETSVDVLKKQTNHPSSMLDWESSVDALKKQTQWPSRLSIHGDTILNVREVKTHESAKALSLANFTTLLVEFVARLQNLVNAFEELSEIAKFSEPVNHLEAKETVGFWTGVLKCIGIKD
ncbi:aluminum-activated malate transporter 4, partial [Lactuca sativa]